MTDQEHATVDVEMVQIEDQSQQQHLDNDGSRNKNDDPFRDENHHDENHDADSSAPLELLLPLVPTSVALCTTRASSTTVEPFSIEAFSDNKKKQRARSDEDDVLTCGICACRYRTYVLLCCLIIATIVASIYVYDLHHVASVDDINNINNNHKVSDDNSVGSTSSSSSTNTNAIANTNTNTNANTNTNTNDERTKNKNKTKNTNKNKKHHHQHDTDATTKKKNEQEEGTTTTTATTTATTNTPPSTQNDNTDLHNWWNATVTKHDGIQYEIVGTIQHDKNAFLYVSSRFFVDRFVSPYFVRLICCLLPILVLLLLSLLFLFLL